MHAKYRRERVRQTSTIRRLQDRKMSVFRKRGPTVRVHTQTL